MRCSIVLLIVLTFPSIAFSATINIPADYPTIQQGIDVAVNGDTVLVVPGTYMENINFLGKAITVTSEQGPDVTVIDGNQSGSAIRFESGEGLDSVIEGFTITNGSGTWLGGSNPGYYGGGVGCLDNASPMIIGNIITKNKSGNEVWTYDKVAMDKSNKEGYWTILAAGESSGNQTTSTKTFTLMLEFDDDDIVKDNSYRASQF